MKIVEVIKLIKRFINIKVLNNWKFYMLEDWSVG